MDEMVNMTGHGMARSRRQSGGMPWLVAALTLAGLVVAPVAVLVWMA